MTFLKESGVTSIIRLLNQTCMGMEKTKNWSRPWGVLKSSEKKLFLNFIGNVGNFFYKQVSAGSQGGFHIIK